MTNIFLCLLVFLCLCLLRPFSVAKEESLQVRFLLPVVFTFIFAITITAQQSTPLASPTPTPAPLPPPSIKIDGYRTAAARIIGAALTSDRAYSRLAYLTDHIGNRLSGSTNLERGIEWAVSEMKRDGLDNVRTEKVMVPHWVRGEESLELLTPVPRKLQMLGLGNSIATPPDGISAEAVVVRNFEELDRLGEQVRGKIVVYNAPYVNSAPPSCIVYTALREQRGTAQLQRSCGRLRPSVCKHRTRAR